MELLFTVLRDWNKTTNERVKLQHTYVVLIVVIIILAGLVTLVNPDLGHTIVSLAGFLFLAFLANSIIWALLKSFVIDRLSSKRPTK